MKAELKFKDFYDVIKENLDSYNGEYDEFINYGPDLFKLLTLILEKSDLESIDRLKINAAIAYFVVPYDVIPEQIYGPYGYVDDIFISTYVLKDISNKIGVDELKKLWIRDVNLQEIIDLCYFKSKEIIGEETENILKYAGLID